MKLIELFDQPLPFEWEDTGRKSVVEAHFIVDDIRFRVQFFQVIADRGSWSVGFTVDGAIGHDPAELGSKGIQVFTTVVHIIDSFFDRENPKSLKVTAMTGKLNKLYNRMAKYFSSRYNFEHTSHGFTITR